MPLIRELGQALILVGDRLSIGPTDNFGRRDEARGSIR